MALAATTMLQYSGKDTALNVGQPLQYDEHENLLRAAVEACAERRNTTIYLDSKNR